MAPEVNEGHYNFKSDIYSLGLTLIELLTVQIPYKECEGALNIYINKKKGILPESFKLITDSGIRDFIMICLNRESKRPTAKELLEKNEWLNNKNKNIVKKTSLFKDNDNDVFSVDNYSSSEELKEDNYFNIDDDSIFDYNEKVVEVSPDGNFGKVNKILYNLN